MRTQLLQATATLAVLLCCPALFAQDVPAEYQQVRAALGTRGGCEANVLTVSIPRNDVVTVANVKTPTPFGFGGWNDSKYGVGDITGRGSIEFWTKSKKMTTKWNKEAGVNWMS